MLFMAYGIAPKTQIFGECERKEQTVKSANINQGKVEGAFQSHITDFKTKSKSKFNSLDIQF